jgi:hypothetical protein
MTNQGWCEGEKINITAATVAGLLVKTFERQEIRIILAFLSVLVASLGALLVAEDVSNTSETGEDLTISEEVSVR